MGKNLARFALLLLFLSSAASTRLHSQNPAVLTWHNGNLRTGQNNQETVLTLSNVNPSTFGKLAIWPVDGKVDAEPLYVPSLSVDGAIHNTLFVATENDSVYAMDALTGVVLWHASLLQAGEATASSSCFQISPQIGITSTPVIDLTQGPHGVIYAVSTSEDASNNYHFRLNALDITTGAQLFGGPVAIHASYPGTGDSSSGGNVIFDPNQYAERAALLDWNGNIYTTWTSHCDGRPYTGWVIAYQASTLKQSQVLNLTPNGNEGAIWMSGAGPAGAPDGIFLLDGNGTFDTTLNSASFPINYDFGNAFLKLATTGTGLRAVDYYATDTTVHQSAADIDLGSGGTIALPVLSDNAGNQIYLAVGAGKDRNIYLVNRYNMGKYHPNGGSIYQVIPDALPGGEWGAPAYFNGNLYYGGVSDYLRQFIFSNAKLNSTAASLSATYFAYPGTTPSVSSNGPANGIVWAVENNSKGAILHAYNSANLADQLYSSGSTGTRDQFGAYNKFVTPMIVNGHVYVGTTNGVAVFGLLPQ